MPRSESAPSAESTPPTDVLGYTAAVLVLLTFYMRGMAGLRVVALCSNVAFLAYAGALHLTPILILHGTLLPLNIWRLAELIAQLQFSRRKKGQQELVSNSSVADGISAGLILG